MIALCLFVIIKIWIRFGLGTGKSEAEPKFQGSFLPTQRPIGSMCNINQRKSGSKKTRSILEFPSPTCPTLSRETTKCRRLLLSNGT